MTAIASAGERAAKLRKSPPASSSTFTPARPSIQFRYGSTRMSKSRGKRWASRRARDRRGSPEGFCRWNQCTPNARARRSWGWWKGRCSRVLALAILAVHKLVHQVICMIALPASHNVSNRRRFVNPHMSNVLLRSRYVDIAAKQAYHAGSRVPVVGTIM